MSPIIGHHVANVGNPWVTLPALALSTWAAFRTRRLLIERDRTGAWMAAIVFVANLGAAASSGHLSWGLAINGLGLILAAAVYRDLRRSSHDVFE